jgi:8-oxo-dGTP pyrophosphatase MutT (NUDIX family)
MRQAARALVTDPEHRVLLVHFEFEWDPSLPYGLWACPGGGIDPGEPVVDALRRELREELGLEIDSAGEPIWVKEGLFPTPVEGARWDGQHDTYFWVEVDSAFEPSPDLTEEEMRAEYVDGMRWWTQAELREAQSAYDEHRLDDPAYAVFSPRRLAHLVDELIAHGRPAHAHRLDPL